MLQGFDHMGEETLIVAKMLGSECADNFSSSTLSSADGRTLAITP